MKNRIIIFAILLVFVTLSYSAKSAAFSSVSPSGHTLYYNFVGGGVTLTSPYEGYTDLYGNVIVPSYVSYNGATYVVNRIGDIRAQYDSTAGPTSINIPYTIYEISGTFNVNSLTTVYFNATNCTSMGHNGGSCFSLCPNFTTLIIGDNVTNIPDYAFKNCSALTCDLIIPNSVTSIGWQAFYGCSGMASISMSDSVVSIGNYAFYNCSGLTGTLTLPNSLTSLNSYTFYNCSGLTDVSLPDSLTSIPMYSFYNCSSLTTLILPEKITSIEYWAFYNCSGLTGTLTIPDSVRFIDNGAFYNCSGISVLNIGKSLTTLGNAFVNCSGLSIINYNVTDTIHPLLEAPTYSLGIGAFVGCTNPVTLNIGDSVPRLPLGVFWNCPGLTTVNYNADSCSVHFNTYGLYVFRGCHHIKTFNIGENVRFLPWNLLYGGLDSMATINYNAINCSFQRGQYGSPFYNLGSDFNLTLFIGENVSSIPAYAFESSDFTTVYFNAIHCTYMPNVFFQCNNLTNLIIGESVTTIPDAAFCRLSGLQFIHIPNSVTEIGGSAFSQTSISSVIIGESVTNIGERCFSACPNLSIAYMRPIIPPNINYNHSINIFSGASENFFICVPSGTISNYQTEWGTDNSYSENCPEPLFSIIISVQDTNEGGVTGDGGYSYGAYIILTATPNAGYYFSHWNDGNTDNPRQITVTRDSTFTAYFAAGSYDSLTYSNVSRTIVTGYLPGLTHAVIPPTVTQIAPQAFRNCSTMTSVTIPSSITFIGSAAFRSCTNLTYVDIPNGVTTIALGAFNECSGLHTVTLPPSVSSIGSGAFANCTELTTINFNADSCTTMGGSNVNLSPSSAVFYNDNNLTTVNIGDNVKVIPESAFYGCRGIASITIPQLVKSIGTNAFANCTDLNTVNYNARFCMSFGSNNAPFLNDSNIVTLNIGNNVERIPAYLFAGCSGLSSVTLPNTLTYLDNGCFYHCSGLHSITFGDSVSYIGQSAFEGCSSLLSITIPDNVGIINQQTFANCTSLNSVSFGNSVFRIEGSAFNNCTSLTSVSLPEAVSYIGAWAFERCNSLPTITIPRNVSYIGGGAFVDCINLTTINYNADSCTWMNSNVTNTFRNDSNIRVLNIGESVRAIPNYAFYGCNTLTEIHSDAPNAPQLGTDVFSGVSDNIPVYIPCFNPASYYSQWNNFTNFIEEYPYSFVAESENEIIGAVQIISAPDCSSSSAVILAVANNGYHFTHWSTGDMANPLTLTVSSDTTIIAFFEADNTEGIDETMAPNANVYSCNGHIIVEGADDVVSVFDITGRLIACSMEKDLNITVPRSGVYMVKVGNYPARKVVVIR